MEDSCELSVSVVTLGWMNEELHSNDWVKVADQPPVEL